MATATKNLVVPGLYDLPPGIIATTVTALEMHERIGLGQITAPEGVELDHWRSPDLDEYRRLYRHIGEDWLWFSRLRLDDAQLSTILHDSDVEIYPVLIGQRAEGILELDFRVAGECELAFFGFSMAHVGRGLGRWLMFQALQLAWARPIHRFWVHTCTLDHPSALAFYQKCGFKPFKQQIEIIEDPRLDGTLSANAAPHVPLFAGSKV